MSDFIVDNNPNGEQSRCLSIGNLQTNGEDSLGSQKLNNKSL